MDVRDAVAARRSIRAFTAAPVADDLIVDLLERASRAPSGGNVQPWRVYLVGAGAMQRFHAHAEAAALEGPGYEIYPANLWEPHRTSRFNVGEQMYELLGIGRADKAARFARVAENFSFFGAPAAIFCFVDRRMGPPQWSDLGMFLQTFMLLAQESGLATCAQEAWSMRSQSVAAFVGAPDSEMLFCGVAIGHADSDAPVNALVSDRLATASWLRVV